MSLLPRAGLRAGLVLLLGTASASAQCNGDCNRDGRTTVAELVRGVNIALGNTPLAMCASLDRNDDDVATVDELVGAVNSSVFSCPIFPSTYRDTFKEVRDCRNSVEHGSVSIRVFANQIAAEAYLDNAATLPVGSIVVKEEFDGPDCCNDDELIRWRVMRKEPPGFDPEDGDWHWQWVRKDRTVFMDDKSTCATAGCHTQSDCLTRDYMCTEGGAPRGRLVPVLEQLPRTVFSVAGTSADDVYVVGADTDDGMGPQVYHYDGKAWERLLTGEAGTCAKGAESCDLWWISVTPIDGSFYMAGDGGLILEYDLATKTFTRHNTPGDALLFGIWGPSEDNLFAVGDNKSVDNPAGVVWRFDGNAGRVWTVDDVTGTTPPLNKVWGPNGNEVYAVGQEGVIIRFDGKSWLDIVSDADRPLFTVHGNSSLVAAVGGFFEPGVILERSGDVFLDVSPQRTLQLNGVFIPPDGQGVAVGREGSVAVRSGECWEARDSGLDTILDFHATWVDPEGGIWAVGGDLSVDLSEGMVAYGGERTIGSGGLGDSGLRAASRASRRSADAASRAGP